MMDTEFLHVNTSSPIEVKKPRPTSYRILTHFTIRAKTRYKVILLVTTCNPCNRLPKDRSSHVQNPLIKDMSKSPLDLGPTHLTLEREIKKDHLTNVLLNKLMYGTMCS